MLIQYPSGSPCQPTSLTLSSIFLFLNMFTTFATVTNMGRPAATEEQRKQQRNRIRAAAADIYQEEGIGALSVRAIAKRAGVSTGLLYSYFSNVSDLMRSLWLRPVAEFGHRVTAIVQTQPEPLDRIKALLVGYAAWAHEHPDVYRGVLLLVRPPRADDPEPQDLDSLPLHCALRDAVTEGQQSGQVRSGDADEIAQVLWAGIHGAIALPVNLDRYAITPSPELAPLMIDALMTSLAPTEGTA